MRKITFLIGVFAMVAALAALAEVNINTATAEELQALDGIGEVKAQAIVEYRSEHGDFKNMSDLTQVPGIGSATAEDLADDVSFAAE